MDWDLSRRHGPRCPDLSRRAGAFAAKFDGTGASLTVVSAGHQQFSDQVLTGMFTVSAALRFTGAILMTWGIISLYLAQADRAGRLGLIAVVRARRARDP